MTLGKLLILSVLQFSNLHNEYNGIFWRVQWKISAKHLELCLPCNLYVFLVLIVVVIILLVTGLCLATWCWRTGRRRELAAVISGYMVWLHRSPHPGVLPHLVKSWVLSPPWWRFCYQTLPSQTCLAHTIQARLPVIVGSQRTVACSCCPGDIRGSLGRTDGSAEDDHMVWSAPWWRDSLWSCPPRPHAHTTFHLGSELSYFLFHSFHPSFSPGTPSISQDWLNCLLGFGDPLCCPCSSCSSLAAWISITALSWSTPKPFPVP